MSGCMGARGSVTVVAGDLRGFNIKKKSNLKSVLVAEHRNILIILVNEKMEKRITRKKDNRVTCRVCACVSVCLDLRTSPIPQSCF